jgi:hypothetical protein
MLLLVVVVGGGLLCTNCVLRMILGNICSTLRRYLFFILANLQQQPTCKSALCQVQVKATLLLRAAF